MIDPVIDSEHESAPITGSYDIYKSLPTTVADLVPPPIEEVNVSSKNEGWRAKLRALAEKKERNLPPWLDEIIGWGGFIVILILFLGVQIYLNGLLSGVANQLVIGLTGIIEIGALWLWELYWY